MVYGWLQAFFPERCPACGGTTHAGFCGVCTAEFMRVQDPCRRCGLARPVVRCPALDTPWRLTAVVAPLVYSPPLDHYVRALKYRQARALARALALLVAPQLDAARAEIDALVPVPLHRDRRIARGYNQAAEIARTLAGELRLPVLERGIVRLSAAPSQTAQPARARRTSVAQAFAVRRDLAGLRIAIVDDVLTTGATANALAARLIAAGAARCLGVAVARTPERSGAERIVEQNAREHGTA